MHAGYPRMSPRRAHQRRAARREAAGSPQEELGWRWDSRPLAGRRCYGRRSSSGFPASLLVGPGGFRVERWGFLTPDDIAPHRCWKAEEGPVRLASRSKRPLPMRQRQEVQDVPPGVGREVRRMEAEQATRSTSKTGTALLARFRTLEGRSGPDVRGQVAPAEADSGGRQSSCTRRGSSGRRPGGSSSLARRYGSIPAAQTLIRCWRSPCGSGRWRLPIRRSASARSLKDVGHFWGLLETRPYTRVRHGLAQCLWHLGERGAASKRFQELLRLNPNDSQGVRYQLAACMLEAGEDDALDVLLVHCTEGRYGRVALVGSACWSSGGRGTWGIGRNPHAAGDLCEDP